MHRVTVRICDVILGSKGVKPIEIHRRMMVQYVDSYLSRITINQPETPGGKHFRSDDEEKMVVHECLQSRPKESFKQGTYVVPKRQNNCIIRQGDNVEKWYL